ncbi:hypothetical protein NQ117_21775 [Paenibacillus sp. SC116]|uniref:hypothetical protein n=1 Tax=Paenibacillus sp. SC116 TaxID=2968986 RepID=UPI00215AF2CE|nr:hypothetical protein [Paenibacillus sp. SC116]MCR8846319.1 hypothetical protein [Paenibacillus sp. SC116]
MMQQSIEAGFALPGHHELVVCEDDVVQLLEKMAVYQRPQLGNKWSQLEAML